MAYYLTLDDAQNQFEFVCPIFNVQTKMRNCMKLRDLVYRGERPTVRNGCQACITSSKCPAAEIARRISYGHGSVPDDYGSKTLVVGKIRRDILERIHRVIVLDKTMRDRDVSEAERELIMTASDRIGKLIGAAPLPSGNMPSRSTFDDAAPVQRKRKPKADNSNETAINEAAATGDLTAAVNAA